MYRNYIWSVIATVHFLSEILGIDIYQTHVIVKQSTINKESMIYLTHSKDLFFNRHHHKQGSKAD